MEKILLVYRVLNGEADEREKRELESLITNDPIIKEDYRDIKLVIESARNFDESVPRSESFYEGLRKIQSRIEYKRSKRFRVKLYKAVFLIAIMVLIFFLIFF